MEGLHLQLKQRMQAAAECHSTVEQVGQLGEVGAGRQGCVARARLSQCASRPSCSRMCKRAVSRMCKHPVSRMCKRAVLASVQTRGALRSGRDGASRLRAVARDDVHGASRLRGPVGRAFSRFRINTLSRSLARWLARILSLLPPSSTRR